MNEFVLSLHAPLVDFVPDRPGEVKTTESPSAPISAATTATAHDTNDRSAMPDGAITEPPAATALAESFQDVCLALGELEQRRRASLQELQELAIELAVTVAERVTRDRIGEGKFAIEQLVAEMVEQFQPQLPLVLRLHPDDLETLQEVIGENGGPWDQNTQLTFESDATMEPGSCRMNTDGFGLSTDLQTQIGMIRQQLLNGIGDAQLERRQTATQDQHVQRFPNRRETA